MNKTFVEEIRNAVAVALEDKIVEVKEFEKANGVIYTGIVIRSAESNIAPTIYINEDFSVEHNVKSILQAYEESGRPKFDVGFMREYEKVKEHLALMITSKPQKDLATEKAPGFEDLYMHAYIIVNLGEVGEGNIKVTNEMLKIWGITSEQLFKDALEVAKINAPSERKSMFETLNGMGVPADTMMDVPFSMDVLSNSYKLYGASAILYTKVKEGTYMIPSSIHEVILLDGFKEDMMLNQMISEVNATEVAPEEYLSNHAYRFNGTNWENVA